MPKFKTADGTEVEIELPEGYFTAEQLEQARLEAIEKARREERDKLYPQQNKTKEQLDAMKAELEELRKAEAARQKERDKAAAEAEKARKAKEEAELSAKELLAQREQTWQQQLEAAKAEQAAQLAQIREQQQLQQAMWEKEKEMAQLALYIRDAVAANQDNIAPELVDLIGGNTKEEVDASVADMIARTGRIVEGMRQAGLAARAGMPGTAPSAGATALTPGIDTGDKQLSPEDIKNMPMGEYAKIRARMGMGAGGGQGIFG